MEEIGGREGKDDGRKLDKKKGRIKKDNRGNESGKSWKIRMEDGLYSWFDRSQSNLRYKYMRFKPLKMWFRRF